MRNLKLQMQITVDSFVAGANGELDWMVWDWDDELRKDVADLTAAVELILLGRNLANGFIDAWDAQVDDPETGEFARKMIDTPKIVFSSSPAPTEWKNTSIVTADLTEEITKLKTADGGDIIVYGGAGFVSSLIENNQIDEYHLFVNPVALGKGMTIFGELEENLRLKLVNSKSFSCGIAALRYEPNRN